MPRGDGTGPMGFGPRMGLGAGYCAGFPMPGFMTGARFGRGWRNIFLATGLTGMQRTAMGWPAFGGGFNGAPASPGPTREQQVQMLKGQAEFLEQQLDLVKKLMEELSAQDAAETEK